MIFYGLNEAVCLHSFNTQDIGGSMIIHTFGAYYGVAASYFFQRERASQSKNCVSNYNSEMIAMVGSIFLWMFWPSFNGALATGSEQQRTMINTVLGICGSCAGAVCVSRFMFKKLEMELILNATLAGGVGVGSAANYFAEPWIALLVGFGAGILSSVGFHKIGPFLSEKIGLQDTCGVHSLHGMPGLYGAIVSAIYLAYIADAGYTPGAIPFVPSEQAANQIFSLLTTLCISIIAGVSGGFFASMSMFKPSAALFKDDDHIEDVLAKYPKEYMVGGDEVYDETKATLEEVKAALTFRRNLFEDQVTGMERLVSEVWNETTDGKTITENNGMRFFSQLVQKSDCRVEMSKAAYHEIFKAADSD